MKWMTLRMISLILFIIAFATAKEEEHLFFRQCEKKKIVIGIDLGTTYSCVGVFKNGRVEIIPNDQGNRITPSYVAFTPEGELLIGDAAKNQLTTNPWNTVFDIKRLIGREWSDPSFKSDMNLYPFRVVEQNGKPHIKVTTSRGQMLFAPEEISAMFLSKIKEMAETYLGEEVTNAVITGTAFFNDAQRQATKDAGSISGLNVMRIINEPTAAAIAYGFDRVKGERNILVFDLGGGTFDASILTVDKGVFQVVATAGNTNLGGENFDHRVMTYLIDLYKKKTGRDISGNNAAVQKLRREVERVKRRLSSVYETALEIDSFYQGQDYRETLTRAKFEELNMDLFLSTIRIIQKVLKEGGLRKEDIDEIVLAGGSTRIPKVRQLVRQFFNGKEPVHGINPDEVIAYGAAIQAAVLNADHGTGELVLLDVNPLPLGLSAANGSMVILIPKNSVIPFKKTQLFKTAEDEQSGVTIQVYEGENPVASNNKLLGVYQYTGLPPLSKGLVQVEVTFKIDANGILKVMVRDALAADIKTVTVANIHHRLRPGDIERMRLLAKVFAQDDKIAKKRSEARNQLESFVYLLKNQISDKGKVADNLSEKEKRLIKRVIEQKIEWLEENQNAKTEEIKDETQTLKDFVIPILKPHAFRYSGSSGCHDFTNDEL